MGNTNHTIKGSINNTNKNHKNTLENGVNSDDEKDQNNNLKISEYDKELSRMLFDEDDNKNNEEEKNEIPQKRKKSLKKEIQDYREQIAEEKFMEEINKSKSVKKYKNKFLNDDDAEDFAEFKKWKETQKNKKQKKEENNNLRNIKTVREKNIKNNNNVNKGLKKRSTSSGRLDVFTNKINSNNNLKNIKDNNNTVILQKNKEKAMKQIMKNYTIQNGYKANTFRNNIPSDEKIINNKQNFNLMHYNTNSENLINNKYDTKTNKIPKNTQEKKRESSENKKIKKSFFSFFHRKKEEKEEKKEKNQKENIEKKDTNIIPKDIYEKVKKEDIKVVSLFLKNGNIKYEHGLRYCGLRKYNDALTCFNQSKNSFTQLNKMMKNNTNIYPQKFREIVTNKVNEKLKTVNISIKQCYDFLKKGKNNTLKNNNAVNNILRNLNFNESLNINESFSKIDDDFDLNSTEPISNPLNQHKTKSDPQKNKNNIHQQEDSEMDAKIESEIMQSNPGVKFSDIVGMQEMKKILYEIIIVPTIRPDFFTGIRKPQRGILLFGPPGTGKTMIAKAIASECKSTFFNISASSLTSKWVGESEKTVKSLFKIAYKKAPSIIFIDEIDSILSKRNESENEATKRLKTEFLIQFDGLGSNTNAKLLVIAATNRPMDLDEALLRRLPKRVYCGPLDVEGRFDFIKKVINRVETKLSDKDIMEIAKMTNGYSNSDLKELCKEAAFQPVRELTMEQILKIKKFRPLVKKDLILAVNKIRGTLSNKIIGELIKWNEQFGGI